MIVLHVHGMPTSASGESAFSLPRGGSIATLRIFAGIGLRTPSEWRPVTVRSAQRVCDRPLTRFMLLTCDGACVSRLARLLVGHRPRRRGDAPPGLRPAAHAVR